MAGLNIHSTRGHRQSTEVSTWRGGESWERRIVPLRVTLQRSAQREQSDIHTHMERGREKRHSQVGIWKCEEKMGSCGKMHLYTKEYSGARACVRACVCVCLCVIVSACLCVVLPVRGPSRLKLSLRCRGTVPRDWPRTQSHLETVCMCTDTCAHVDTRTQKANRNKTDKLEQLVGIEQITMSWWANSPSPVGLFFEFLTLSLSCSHAHTHAPLQVGRHERTPTDPSCIYKQLSTRTASINRQEAAADIKYCTQTDQSDVTK